MEKRFRLPFVSKKGVPSEKNGTLLQVIIVISSGILSSSVIATALKTWIENRRTTLTIKIDGSRKTLTYNGHHLSQDAPIIQTFVATLSEETHPVIPLNTVTIDITDDGPTEEALLETGRHQNVVAHDDHEHARVQSHPSHMKRFLSQRSREIISFSRNWEKRWRKIITRYAS